MVNNPAGYNGFAKLWSSRLCQAPVDFAGRLTQAPLQLVCFRVFHFMQLAIQIAGVLGFLGVALGAFGAHQLASLLNANQTSSIWQTAVLYHLVHAVAALWAAGRNPTVVWIWAAGIVILSGSLYLLAITNIRWLGAITPIGGLLFLAGWLLVVIKPQ